MNPTRAFRVSCCVAAALVLTACGGGNASIGGTLSGLGTGLTVTLQNNGDDDLTLSENGSFEFDTTMGEDDSYDVTVLTQPEGQTCTVANGTGSVDADEDDIRSITVTCSAQASLGGTVTGLRTGASVTLGNDGQEVTVASNGEFVFPGVLEAGTAYSVTVVTQPAVGSCSVSEANGTIVEGETAMVTVTCS